MEWARWKTSILWPWWKTSIKWPKRPLYACSTTICCLTHNPAGVGTITWPRVRDPPQGVAPPRPLPTTRWNHNMAESAESEAYRGRECRQCVPAPNPLSRTCAGQLGTGQGHDLLRASCARTPRSTGAHERCLNSSHGRRQDSRHPLGQALGASIPPP